MPFKKGQSGNPGGRKKKTPEMVEIETLARSHSPAAIKRLAYWMEGDDPGASVKACQIILDRAWGKPQQQIEHKGAASLAIQVVIVGQTEIEPPTIDGRLVR